MTWHDADGEQRWGEREESWQRAPRPPLPEIPDPRPCRHCGRTFAPFTSSYQRCPDCSRQWAVWTGQEPAKIDTKPCAICGAGFTAPAHWKRCNDCRRTGRTLARERGAYRVTMTVDELRKVGVSVLDYGVVRCDRCGTTWETIARAGEPLSDGYWRCPLGCNVKEGAP